MAFSSKLLMFTVCMCIIGSTAAARAVKELAEELSPNCRAEYISQYGHAIQTYSNACALEIDQNAASLSTGNELQIKDIPLSQVHQVEEDFASEGFHTSRFKQRNGLYAVTAKNSKTPDVRAKNSQASKANAEQIFNALSVQEIASPVSQTGTVTFTKEIGTLICQVTINVNTNNTVNAECFLGGSVDHK